jgi:universal stress protein E
MTGTYAPRGSGITVNIVHLVVIIDPTSTKQPALAKALAIATQFDAAVTLLSLDTTKLRELRLAKKSPWRKSAPRYASLQAWLDHLAIPLRARGIDVTTQVVAGDPDRDSLLCWLRQSDVDFALKDLHPHTSAKRAFLTDSDWRLVRFCPIPLLLCRPRQWQDSPIVVASVDPLHGSDPYALLDHEIMAYAAYIVKRLNGKLHAFHALNPAAGAMTAIAGVPRPKDVDQAHAVNEQQRRWAIKAFVRRYAVAKERLHVTIGLPETLLPRIAMEHNADIVVMGALARNGVTGAEVGRTAAAVLDSLPCDVLVLTSSSAR